MQIAEVLVEASQLNIRAALLKGPRISFPYTGNVHSLKI